MAFNFADKMLYNVALANGGLNGMNAANPGNLNTDARVSFAELCQKAGRLDIWKQVCREQYDLLGFTAAVLAGQKTASA